MASLSKTDERCKMCQYNDSCKHKRMMKCAMAELPEQLTEEVLVKHDYRDIKIAPNTTVTIDLEELKKKAAEEIYKQLNCNFMQNGA